MLRAPLGPAAICYYRPKYWFSRLRAVPNYARRVSFGCRFTFNSKKMATLVDLEEPQTYIGCRFAGNVGSRFLRRFGG
jgi:hypothetical protein